jgi:GNAT superfamily N-acetyltransferase
MTDPLYDELQTALGAANTVQTSRVQFAVEDPTTADAQWCLEQYFAEINKRFENGFDAGLSTLPDARELTPPVGLFLVARLHNQPIGCGALRFHGDGPADIKRMWIAPSARGSGLGHRLLHELEEQARAAGVSVVRLETNRALREAIALYRRSGYVDVAPFNDELYAHHWFEKRLS